MNLLNTDMHMVTFAITMFEFAMLFFQVIYYLERTNDKKRLLYLILLVFLILYNIFGGLFPDEQFPFSYTVQLFIEYLVGFTMSMYFVYYFYAALELEELKFFATKGAFIFIFLPFVFLFIVPYLLTDDLDLARRLTVVIPFFYGVAFLAITTRALRRKFKTPGAHLDKRYVWNHIVPTYISGLCWATLPVIVYFGDNQLLEHSVTNAGFLVMSIIYVKTCIYQSRDEYDKLLASERSLQELNSRLQVKVQERTKELEHLVEKGKNTFVNLVHETKTPLTLINNYLQDYIEKTDNKSPELLIAKSNVQKLTSDIVNFFDILSYDKGFQIYDHSKVSDFSAILKVKIELFKALAARKEIKFESSIGDGILIKAHPSAIERITNNLIENAIKYCHENKTVIVQLQRESAYVAFTVKDEGVGIPKRIRKKIYDPFFKLSTTERNYEGMGMGLAIVKKIIDDLHGQILLESKFNIGSEFKVLLPALSSVSDVAVVSHSVSKVVDLPIEEFQLKETDNNSDKQQILIVEDNVRLLEYLVSKLKQQYNVAFARNGIEALQRIQTLASLDLVISDIMMNRMDGFEFIKAMSASKKFQAVPFIFLTAKTGMEDKLQGLKLGAIDYIEKPFLISHLMLKVESILNHIRIQQTTVIERAIKSVAANSGTNEPVISSPSNNYKKFNLTSREVEIVELLSKGHPYKIIASSLNISQKTVNSHITNIFSKVGVTNKVELISRLNGLLPENHLN